MKVNSETNKGKSFCVYKKTDFANVTARRKRKCVFSMYYENKCKARIETNEVIVVDEYGEDDHSDKVSTVVVVTSFLQAYSCEDIPASVARVGVRPTSYLSVFLSYLLRVFILCTTDTDVVALSELQVAVLFILHLRFC